MIRVGPLHCPTQYSTDFSLHKNLKTFEQNIWFPMKSAFRLSGSQLTITLAPVQWPQAPVSCVASGQQCNAWNQYKSFVSLSSFISCSSSLEIGLRRLTCWHAPIRFCNSIYATFSECRTGKYISGEDPAESAVFVCMCERGRSEKTLWHSGTDGEREWHIAGKQQLSAPACCAKVSIL